MFTSDDSTLIWRKNKGILLIDGVRAHDIVKVLGKYMCDEFDSGVSTDKVGQASMQPCDVYEAVETLKFGQSLNSEAIQTLSGSVLQLSTVVAQSKVLWMRIKIEKTLSLMKKLRLNYRHNK